MKAKEIWGEDSYQVVTNCEKTSGFGAGQSLVFENLYVELRSAKRGKLYSTSTKPTGKTPEADLNKWKKVHLDELQHWINLPTVDWRPTPWC